MSGTFKFAPSSLVRPHPEQLAAQLDGQVVVLGMVEGKYVGFDDIATTIWQRIEKNPTITHLCQGLVTDYEGDPAEIERDVYDILEKLQKLSLIIIEPPTS